MVGIVARLVVVFIGDAYCTALNEVRRERLSASPVALQTRVTASCAWLKASALRCWLEFVVEERLLWLGTPGAPLARILRRKRRIVLCEVRENPHCLAELRPGSFSMSVRRDICLQPYLIVDLEASFHWASSPVTVCICRTPNLHERTLSVIGPTRREMQSRCNPLQLIRGLGGLFIGVGDGYRTRDLLSHRRPTSCV